MRLSHLFWLTTSSWLFGTTSMVPKGIESGSLETTTLYASTQPPQSDRIDRIGSNFLPNAVRVHERVVSGGLPEGEAAFEELQAMGIKTIISVDGAKPNVELANRFGLRYVHMPHGYDGISETRGLELAKAVRDLPGPIYIHCHHGKHRSPAAAAVACLGAGLIQADQAERVLAVAGTNTAYRGLFRSVAEARLVDQATLDSFPIEYQSIAKLPALAEAMVEVEHYFDQLARADRNGWADAPVANIDSPSHLSLLLREQYSELLRTEECMSRPADYQRLMREAESLCRQLEQSFQAEPNVAEKRKLFEAIQANCKACHQTYRDNPASLK